MHTERTSAAAEAGRVRRAAHVEACRRTLDISATLPAGLSALERRVFALLTVLCADVNRQPVALVPSEVAKALDITEGAACDAIERLTDLGTIVEVRDAFGIRRSIPAPGTQATITAGERRQ